MITLEVWHNEGAYKGSYTFSFAPRIGEILDFPAEEKLNTTSRYMIVGILHGKDQIYRRNGEVNMTTRLIVEYEKLIEE